MNVTSSVIDEGELWHHPTWTHPDLSNDFCFLVKSGIDRVWSEHDSFFWSLNPACIIDVIETRLEKELMFHSSHESLSVV